MILFFLCTRINYNFKGMKKGNQLPAYSFLPNGTCQITLTEVFPANCENITISLGPFMQFRNSKELESEDLDVAREYLIKHISNTFLINSIHGRARLNATMHQRAHFDLFFLPPVANFSCKMEFVGNNPNSHLDYWIYPIVHYMPYCIFFSQFSLAVWVAFFTANRLKFTAETVLFSFFLVLSLAYNSVYYIEIQILDKSDEYSTITVIRCSLLVYEFFFFVLFLPLSQVTRYLSEKRKKCVIVVHVLACLIAVSTRVLSEIITSFSVQRILMCMSDFIVSFMWLYFAIKTECNRIICILYTVVGMYVILSYLCAILVISGLRHWVIKLIQDIFLNISTVLYIIVYYHHFVKEESQEDEVESDDLNQRLFLFQNEKK